MALLSTLTPWRDSDIGVTEASGLLAAIACIIGLTLHVLNIRPGWMGAAFAAAVMWREVSRGDVGVGLIIGAVCATLAAVIMIWQLLAAIRESAQR